MARLHSHDGDISFRERYFFNGHAHLRLKLAVSLYPSEILKELVGYPDRVVYLSRFIVGTDNQIARKVVVGQVVGERTDSLAEFIGVVR